MLKLLAVAVAVALVAGGVSGETHHVAVAGGDSGWGPDFNVTAWLLGRRFTVGDKLRFECSGEDEGGIVEVRGAEELETCNLSNPIRMRVSDVALEEEGIRYFTSGNPDTCKKGLKIPVSVHDQYKHRPPHEPYEPDVPSPPHEPPHEPDVPSPPHQPYDPSPPYDPDVPSPPHKAPPPPPQPFPSAATRLHALCTVLAAAMIVVCGLTI